MKQTKFNSKTLLFMLFLLCCLAGCKTSRKAETSKLPESARYLSSKVKLTVPTKDAVFTVNGTMKLISGERMQLSFLMPIIRTEVARMEVTPEEILLVDRMGVLPVRNRRMCCRRKPTLPIWKRFCSTLPNPTARKICQERNWVFPPWRKAKSSCPTFPMIRFL